MINGSNMKVPENEEEYIQMLIDKGYTDGWYFIGKLEWPPMPYTDNSFFEYNEAPIGFFGNEDYLWTKMIVHDTYKKPEGAQYGDPAIKTGEQHRSYYWCIGIPPNGDTTYRNRPWPIMEILQHLADRGSVSIGRATERNGIWTEPIQYVPTKVRLKGMSEWITGKQSQDVKENTTEEEAGTDKEEAQNTRTDTTG